MGSAALNINVPTVVTREWLKPLGRQKVTGLFVDLPDNTLEVRLVVLTVAPKECNLARLQDARNVVTLLKQQTTKYVNEDRTSVLAMH